MQLDWNKNGHLDAVDYLITEMLDEELEEMKRHKANAGDRNGSENSEEKVNQFRHEDLW